MVAGWTLGSLGCLVVFLYNSNANFSAEYHVQSDAEACNVQEGESASWPPRRTHLSCFHIYVRHDLRS